MSVERPAAAILAGGASRRMGRDKALLPLPDGRPACQAVLDAARTVANRVLLLVDTEEHARRVLSVLAPPLPEVLLDSTPGAGPLAALAGALAACRESALLLLAVDAPLVGPEALSALYVSFCERPPGDGGPWIAAPMIGGLTQPMPAVYDPRLAEEARRLLCAGRRDLRALLESPAAHLHQFPEADLAALGADPRTLLGINTPEEWAALQALLTTIGSGHAL